MQSIAVAGRNDSLKHDFGRICNCANCLVCPRKSPIWCEVGLHGLKTVAAHHEQFQTPGITVSQMLMAKFDLFAADAVDHFTVDEYGPPHHPRANGPAGERFSMPWRPTTFCQLGLIQNRLRLIEIDKDKIRVIAFADVALSLNIPDPCWGRRCPRSDLAERTASPIYFV